ncbi:hypothetical protein TNCV_489761 [Trichonephila clavipes]|nr:hypothetical protein TNCV_489761 [Trichonephila clavipes]
MKILWNPRLTPERALLIGILDMVFILSQCIPAKRIPYDDGFPKDKVESLLYDNENLQSYQSDDINMDSESKADQPENYDTNGESLYDWSTESFDTNSEVLWKRTAENSPIYKSDDINMDIESKADQLGNYDTNKERLPYWSTEGFDTSSEVLSKQVVENLPSYKSDDINMDIESKADQLGNYDNNGEGLPDWSAENSDTNNEVLRKKTLAEFMSLSDNVSKKFAILNPRDSPDESFDESLSSSENNVLLFDKDNENELLTRYNRDHIPSPSENNVFRFDEDNENELLTRSYRDNHILSPSENNALRFEEDNENDISTRANREDQTLSSTENKVLRFDEDNENEILTRYYREDHTTSPSENNVFRFDEDNENDPFTRSNREDHIPSPSENNVRFDDDNENDFFTRPNRGDQTLSSTENKVLRFNEDNENKILTRYNREDNIPSPSENNVFRFDEDNENDLFTRSNRGDQTLSSSENKVLRFDEDNENEILTRYNKEHIPSPPESNVFRFDEDNENDFFTRSNRGDQTLSSSENKVLRFDEDNENEILTRYNREDHIPSPFESKVLNFDEDKENELLTRHNREDIKEDYVLDSQTTTPVIPIASWMESILLKRKEKELRNQNNQLYTVLVDMSQRNRKLQDEVEKFKSLYSEP